MFVSNRVDESSNWPFMLQDVETAPTLQPTIILETVVCRSVEEIAWFQVFWKVIVVRDWLSGCTFNEVWGMDESHVGRAIQGHQKCSPKGQGPDSESTHPVYGSPIVSDMRCRQRSDIRDASATVAFIRCGELCCAGGKQGYTNTKM
jgi:hypothetical protein